MNLVLFKNARQQVSTVHNVVATACVAVPMGGSNRPNASTQRGGYKLPFFDAPATTDSGEDAALGEPSALDWAWVWEWVAGLKLE